MSDFSVPKIVGPFLKPRRSMVLFMKLARLNWIFIALLLLLGSIGYLALYSAAGGAAHPFAFPQAVRFALGLILMAGAAMIPPAIWRRAAWPFYLFSLALLALVLKMGHVGKGAERWINLAGIQFQPSELAKIGLVLALAAWFSMPSQYSLKNPLKLLMPIVLILLPVALVLKEPNLGTAVIIGVIGASLLFAAGMQWWQIAALLVPLPFLGKVLYGHLHDYQKARIVTFLHPEHDPLGAGYNILQSRIALGSGGMWGQGYLRGSQSQLNFLPEKQTDFIFTLIGEEWGYVGAIGVIILLFLVVSSGMVMAMRCSSRFTRLLALGISIDFFLYCAVNLSMVMGAIPVGGVPLPLISYGGSALLMMMLGFGLLLSCWVHRREEGVEVSKGGSLSVGQTGIRL